MSAYQKLKGIFKQLSDLTYIKHIMIWDDAVIMPEGAGQARAEAMGTFSSLMQKQLISKKNKKLIDAAKQETDLTAWDQANLVLMEKKYLKSACIPAKLTEKLTKETFLASQVWRKYRAENNWRDFMPYLNRTFKLVKEVAKRQSEVLSMNPYDAMIDEYGSGFNQASIDPIFAALKKELPILIDKIQQKQRQDTITIPKGPFKIDQQKELGLKVTELLQFDFKIGRLDVSHHPFCIGAPTDVRITTRYNEKEFLSSILGIAHETGHGLYEQGFPRDWMDQPAGRQTNMAVHESQSLLVEKQVACSKAFYEFLGPHIEKQFGKEDSLSAQNLFKVVTQLKPNYIRVDADEVTYPLHVILRYEIEKELFNDEITVKDLPKRWNELMLKYLNLSTDKNYTDGVMQDIHWPWGGFGYFPSYTLGRLMAAQFFEAFIKSHPNFFDELKQGHFGTLKKWLSENIYLKASSLTPEKLLQQVTGKPLDIQYFIEHVKQRYLN